MKELNKKMSIPISAIIPVYNVEDYLEECLNSVLKQSYKEFEVILINDGSTDSSDNICKRYMEQDSRVKLINKKNGGLASACLRGIEEAKGDYIIFIDSDDWIELDTFQTLYNTALTHKVEVVLAHAIREFSNKSVDKKMHLLKQQKYYATDIADTIFPNLISNGYRVHKSISNSRCAKLYVTELIRNNLKYYRTDIVNGEDLQLTFPTILDAKSIYCLNDYYPYHYRVNDSSITRTYNKHFFEESIKLYHHIETIANEKAVYDFSSQLRIWFANRILVAVEQEVKSSIGTSKEKIDKIKDICNHPITKNTIKRGDFRKFTLRDKLLLSLTYKGFATSIYNQISMQRTIKQVIKR